MELLKKEIYLEKAGTLKYFITDNEKMSVSHLMLSGLLNLKDFDVLDEMCTSSVDIGEDDNHTIIWDESPFLKVLDLGDTVLLDDFTLGEFTYHSKLEKIVLPKNLESKIGRAHV